MLSYQHSYHAGNYADVLKHWVLVECLEYLKKKDKPFDVIDTHAGDGYYLLNSADALKTGESAEGVGKVIWSDLPDLARYYDLIAADLKKNAYPGSPTLINRMLRPGDHAWFFELHPQALSRLQQNCAKKRVSYVMQENGYEGLIRLLPTQSKRALAMIDPSFELKDEYKSVVDVMGRALKKMPNMTLLLWYPVAERSYINRLEADIKNSRLRNVQLYEIGVSDDEARGMSASGMIAVNPPWTLADQFKSTAPTLAKMLSQDGKTRWRFEQLCKE